VVGIVAGRIKRLFTGATASKHVVTSRPTIEPGSFRADAKLTGSNMSVSELKPPSLVNSNSRADVVIIPTSCVRGAAAAAANETNFFVSCYRE